VFGFEVHFFQFWALELTLLLVTACVLDMYGYRLYAYLG